MIFPATTIDRRVDGHNAYIFDVSALQAIYLIKDNHRVLWQPVYLRFSNLRDHPKHLEHIAQNGIDQLLAKIDFIDSKRGILAPRQRTEFKGQLEHQRRVRKDELTVPEKQYGAVQYGIYDAVNRLEEETPPEYAQLLEIVERIIDDLEQRGKAKWEQANHSQRPSRVDKSIAATAAALAYTGTSTCVLTRDASLIQVVRTFPRMLGTPSGTLSVAGSLFFDVNAHNSVKVG